MRGDYSTLNNKWCLQWSVFREWTVPSASQLTPWEGKRRGHYRERRTLLMGAQRNKVSKWAQDRHKANPLHLPLKSEKLPGQHQHFPCLKRAASLCSSSSARGFWVFYYYYHFLLPEQNTLSSLLSSYQHLHLLASVITKNLCFGRPAPAETQPMLLPSSQAVTHMGLH